MLVIVLMVSHNVRGNVNLRAAGFSGNGVVRARWGCPLHHSRPFELTGAPGEVIVLTQSEIIERMSLHQDP